jgi:hypothetical protein
MKESFLHLANPSFLIWLDNLICQEGSGHYQASSLFYKTTNQFQGLYTYSSPYSQFIYDVSVSGATVMTGIYLNNNFITTGTSGFFGVNYEKGQVYFNTALPSSAVISGNFSVKDFNLILTNDTEQKILFETQYTKRPKTLLSPTGLRNNEISYPVAFVKNLSYSNTPFAIGGIVSTDINYSVIVFSDDKYKLDSVIPLMCDSYSSYLPILNVQEMPFDIYGRCKSGVYNYQELKQSKTPTLARSLFVQKASQAEFSQKLYSEIDNVNPTVQIGIVDFSVSAQRTL